MPAVRMPLIQSAMALRTVSIQSPSLAEVVDKGLEKVQEENNVGQKLQTAEGYPLLLKPPYGIIDSEADENKNADCFSAIGKS